jgi:oligosaccharide:H+ symporter
MMKSEKRMLWSLISYNSLFYVAAATFGPFISVYYNNKGLSITQIGLLSEVGALVALFIQPMWGITADRKNKRRQFLMTAIIGAGVFVMSYLLASGFYSFLICAFLFSIFSCAIGPLGDTVAINIAEKYEFKYSTIRMGGTISYAFVVILAGIFIKSNPRLSFPVTSCIYLLMLLTVLRLPDVYRKEKKEIQKRKVNAHDILQVVKNKKVLFILFFLCIFQIVLGCYGSYLSILVMQLGYDNRMIGILMCVSAVSEIPILLNLDRIIRRFGTINVMLFAGFILVIRIFLPSLGSITGIILAQMLQGFTYMIMYYSTVMYMIRNLKEELHSTGQSLLCLVQAGIASLFSNVIGGYLCDRLGIVRTYRLYGSLFLGALIIIVVFLCFYRRNTKQKTKIL